VNREVPSDRELELLSIRAGQALLGRGEVVTLAESCTGGYVAKLITDVPGSSRWFHSGFVTYSDMAKHRQLGVSQTTLAKEGAVSERTALEMAVGALAVSGAHRAIAITGIAGPDGGSDAKPVGLVWFARAVRIEEGSVGAVGLQRRFNGDRDAVRRQAAAYALELLFDP
jgi:nicotinamide-nucleotide amidase